MLSISAARRVTAGARATRGGRVGGVGVGVGRGAGAPALLLRSQHHQLMMNKSIAIPSSFYSTERILSLRNKEKKEVLPKTLYTPQHETENCGVGLVASLKSVASRKVVEDADEMLIRMSHRGGVGCCPASGDGAGEYSYLVERVHVLIVLQLHARNFNYSTLIFVCIFVKLITHHRAIISG
jgi:hypothetical protein